MMLTFMVIGALSVITRSDSGKSFKGKNNLLVEDSR
jgi:hypothetical protein